MKPRTFALTLIITGFLLLFGCATGHVEPTLPPIENELSGIQSDHSQTHLWGYYNVDIDLDSRTAHAVPDRGAMFEANVVTFLNMHPADLDFDIKDIKPGANYTDVNLNIWIIHPFPNMPQYNGYDVRGVFIGDGSGTLKYNTDLKYPVLGTDQFCFNEDGYTRWFNPKEFATPGVLGYTEGVYASHDYSGTATLNPFVYYTDGLGVNEAEPWPMNLHYEGHIMAHLDEHGVFSSGMYWPRRWELRFPKSKGVNFDYAVLASWKGEAPADHPANASEPVYIATDWVDSTSIWRDPATGEFGGKVVADIAVFDWDKTPVIGTQTTFYRIIVDSDMFDGPHVLTPFEMIPTGNYFWDYPSYHVEIPVTKITKNEGNDFWIVAEDLGSSYQNQYGVPNSAGSDTLAAFERERIPTPEEQPRFIEEFNVEPSGWYYGTYAWGSGPTLPAPEYSKISPYVSNAYNFPGSVRFPPSGNYVDGGVVATVVTPPFHVPTGFTKVWLTVNGCLGGGSGWDLYWGANCKIAESSTPGLAPFNASGKLVSGVEILEANSYTAGDYWGAYDTPSLYADSLAMAGQPAWSEPRGGGAFPSELTTKLYVYIPSKYFGKKVKIAFQFQTDDVGYAGYGTGFALDSYVLWVY